MTGNTNIPMAWNEPGDGKKRDPWGGNNQEGPPDLDEVFRKFQDKIGSIFGKKPKDTKGGGLFIALLLVVILFAYGISGFFIVQPAEQAVITRFGKYNRTLGEGPHWVPRFIDTPFIVNTGKLNSSRHNGWMLTKDENIIYVEMEVQYRILDPEKYMFSVNNPDRTLRQAADSALRQAIGGSILEGDDDIMTVGKQKVTNEIREELSSIIDRYDLGMFLDTVVFKDPRPPEQVEDAFDDATKSREDKERYVLQAEAYGNKLIPEAEGAAKQLLLEAEGYKEETILMAIGSTSKFEQVLPEYKKAPKVTETRLYLDTVEQMLSRTSKVIVDVSSGNNLIYLPVDRLMQNQDKTNSNNEVVEGVRNFTNEQNNPVTQQLSRRRRGRE